MPRLSIVSAFLLLGAGLLHAQEQSDDPKGDDTIGGLLRWCQVEQGPETAYCLGFINGMAQGHGVLVGLSDESEKFNVVPLFCLPPNWTIGQGEAVFERWAEENPDKWHDHARYGVMSSFIEAFPCDENSEEP